MAVAAARHNGSVDAAMAIDSEGAFLSGWLSGVGEDESVRVVGPAGENVPVELGFRFARPDVLEMPDAQSDELHGFACLASLPAGLLQRDGLRLEIEAPDGTVSAFGLPDAVVDPTVVRTHLLRLLEFGRPSPSFMSRHVYPALERLRDRLADGLGVRNVVEHGSIPADPEISIVIPVYGRLDLVTPQVAALADDPQIRGSELVLVLDSPELEAELVELTYHLEALYRLPMRIVTMKRNGGFGYANNVGAQHASGAMLLMLNSDVFPKSIGWLSTLTDALRADDVVAAGAKLVYEDESLQHAGMYFHRDGVSGEWENLHFYKGMPGTLAAANESRRVPALTAACMLVDRRQFLDAGGFDLSYVLGDYEDSDLCLRLQESGGHCRYLAEAELYHLERQSFASETEEGRSGIGRVTYNRWLFNHRWGEQLQEMRAGPPPSPADASANGGR